VSFAFGFLLILALGAALLPQLLAQETVKLVPALGWDLAVQGGFPTSIAADAQNAIWVGTEGNGVWRYDPREKKWIQFTTKDGLGDDDVYAVAVDKVNRVWIGHLNHGVSVWNGEKWKNYGLLDGPLGDRVFAIAVCPTDGDVWVATDCGLARYSVAKEDWDYYTRASGLPSNQIQCVAFAPNGDILVGTQCDGIARARAADQYKKWHSVPGPLKMPNSSKGEGLPSGLINDLSIIFPESKGPPAEGGMGLAATPMGVGAMSGGGDKWSFIRGADWQVNVSGLFDGPIPDQSMPIKEEDLAMEDWVTCARQEEKTRRIWIGYRRKGVEVRNSEGGETMIRCDPEGAASLFVRALWLGRKAPALIAIYDDKQGGLKTFQDATASVEPGAEPVKTPAAFPAPAKAPTAESFPPLTNSVGGFHEELPAGEGDFLGDDWRTQGDWLGRYGNSFAMLCGVIIPGRNFENEPGFAVRIGVGPHVKNSGPFSYIENLTTENPRVLYDPTIGQRREAEQNDGSFKEADYPPDWEGPDLWVDVTVPEGTHCVSLYFHNNDAQKGRNKYRDYDLQLLTWAEDRDEVQKSEPLARARVTDFAGGVYKMFVVAGPAHYVVRVGRNRSFVTKLQGVFIDRLTGEFPEKRQPFPGFADEEYSPPTLEDSSAVDNDALLSAAQELWSGLDEAFDKRAAIGLQLPLRLWAYRAAVAGAAPSALLATWRWQIGIWTPQDRREFREAMTRAFEAYQKSNPDAGKEK
jgi:hypothetical protein